MNKINIVVNIESEGWGTVYETFEGEYIEGGKYKIVSYPRLSTGIHYLDIVEVEKIDGNYFFVKVVQKSESFAVRIAFLNKDISNEKMYSILGKLQLLGGYVEKPFYLLASVSFIDSKNKLEIFSILEHLSTEEALEYEEF